jgi:ribosomal 50S subunit-recycling heat shock protein
MKTTVKTLVIALIVLTFSGLSFAQEKAATPAAPAKTATKAKATRITGEVTSVDAKAGTLAVKTKDKDVNLDTDAKAKAALKDVKVGDMVRVSYTEKDGKMVASSVGKAKAPAAKATTEKKSETK